MDVKKPSKKKEKTVTNIIEVKNLRKMFDTLAAVDDISFDVREGEIFALLGPNGAGKSTTIRMLTTMLHPTSGTILLNKFDPVTQPHETRQTFGIIFQDQSLDDELTAYENMKFHGVLYSVPKQLMEKRIEQLLRVVELWDRKNDLVKTFSGGMRRRLEIARGLLHHPKILFLDEPTIGLDPQTRNHIWTHIAELNKSEHITVFFTTHYMEEAEKMADRVAVVDHGKIIAKGTPQEIIKSTKTKNLEDAFIKITGSAIRQQDAGNEELRMRRAAWTGRR